MPAGTYKTFKQASKRVKRDASPRRKVRRQNAVLNRQELKAFDTAISSTLDTTTEVINTSLNLVQTGDTFQNRDGATILVKSVQIVGRVAQVPAAAAVSAPIAYIWVVWDKQPNGASLTAANAATGYLNTDVAQSALPTVPTQYRFKTLARIVIPLNSSAGVTTAYNNYSQEVNYYHKFKEPLEIRFSASTGAITDVMSNNLAIVAGAADSDDTISFTGTARIRFTG